MKLPNKIKPFLITFSLCCICAHAQEKSDGDTNSVT